MGKLTISMAIFKSYETNYQRVLTEQVLTSPVRWSQGQAKKTERSRIAAEVPDCAAYCWLAIPQRCCLDQPCSVLSHYREASFNIRVNSSLELASSDHPRSIHRNFKLIELNPIVDPHEIIKKSSWNHQEIIMKSSWNHPPNQSYPAACSQTSVVLCNSFSLCAFTAWKLREICPFETEVKLDISSCGVINNSMMGWSNPDGG